MTVRASGGSSAARRQGIEDAFAAIARVHATMSAHDPGSELSALNAHAATDAVAVSADTYAVLECARGLHLASGGLFDAAVAPQLARWGYVPRHLRRSRRGTTADVQLLSGGRVRFAKPLALDLGGIAKGYAVDLAVRALHRAGVPQGSVAAGGDLRVFGPREEIVHVRDPRQPQWCVPLLVLRNGAAATSATYFSTRRHRGRLVSAVAVPGTNQAYTGHRSVTVVAQTCMMADGLTKVALLGGHRVDELLRRFGASARVLPTTLGTSVEDGHAA